jgi:hypothetical protein
MFSLLFLMMSIASFTDSNQDGNRLCTEVVLLPQWKQQFVSDCIAHQLCE